MSLVIQLLGHPRISRSTGEPYLIRSRKSWALLACLLLEQRVWTRVQLAGLLFSDADDPLRALRWNLSELRRALGDGASLEGDPVVLTLHAGTVVDALAVTVGTWAEAVRLDGLGQELLEGLDLRGASTFDSWLLATQRRLAAASEAVLREAALGTLARGDIPAAIAHAVRALALGPLDEDNHALVIRLYRLAGDEVAAQRQYDACIESFEVELGIAPGPAIGHALAATRRPPEAPTDRVSMDAIVEAGLAAVAAGAVQAGIDSLRAAAAMADVEGSPTVRIRARQALGGTLVHAQLGLDGEGLACLHEANGIALATGDREGVARARAELGYVDFLGGRYERADKWLHETLQFADGDPVIVARATAYLGCVASDRADYPLAETLLVDACEAGSRAGLPRLEAYARSMLGRLHALRGDFDEAAADLDEAIHMAEADHWLAFLPWPQALRGEVQVARDDLVGARPILEQAFARACQVGDPCWEGVSARALAGAERAAGRVDRAFEVLLDAQQRCRRSPAPYHWLDVHILDALCDLGVRDDHPSTPSWVEEMRVAAARGGMRELTVRALRHAAALGDARAGEVAELMAATIDNPLLRR